MAKSRRPKRSQKDIEAENNRLRETISQLQDKVASVTALVEGKTRFCYWITWLLTCSLHTYLGVQHQQSHPAQIQAPSLSSSSSSRPPVVINPQLASLGTSHLLLSKGSNNIIIYSASLCSTGAPSCDLPILEGPPLPQGDPFPDEPLHRGNTPPPNDGSDTEMHLVSDKNPLPIASQARMTQSTDTTESDDDDEWSVIISQSNLH
jgi:hypothetical protein